MRAMAKKEGRDCTNFNSCADLELGAWYLFNHLRRLGLLMHTGVGTTLSETEAMFFPPPRVDYSNADTSRFDICNADGSIVGFVDFTKNFKYIFLMWLRWVKIKRPLTLY